MCTGAVIWREIEGSGVPNVLRTGIWQGMVQGEAPKGLVGLERMFYPDCPMATLSPDVTAAMATLQARWGAAAPRVSGTVSGGIAGGTDGALALALTPVPAASAMAALAPSAMLAPAPLALASAPAVAPLPGAPLRDVPRHADDRVIHTGFAALDAILGPGGLPRSASIAIRGDGSSGRTTLALRVAAEAQAQGSVVAWLDLARSFDPVEAVARGVDLEWLVVITPASLDEGLAIAGSLLTGRSVDLLFLDLPGGRLSPTDSPARIADRLGRLAAFARRSDATLVVLETPGPAGGLSTAVAEATGLRLELARRSWIRLRRDVVGQRTEAVVTRNRYGPPGRRATLRILYAEGGERDACLRRQELLVDPGPLEALGPPTTPPPSPSAAPPPTHAPAIQPERTIPDATHPPPPAAPPPPARPGARLRTLPAGPDRVGRPAVGSGAGHRRGSGGPGPGRPARDAARERPPARP